MGLSEAISLTAMVSHSPKGPNPWAVSHSPKGCTSIYDVFL
ncbi:hypothetical protein [Arundinibacter roseus]|nr:hypothetical protein [Arundinibacter roseus]